MSYWVWWVRRGVSYNRQHQQQLSIIKSQTNLWSSLRSALSSQVLHEIGLIRVSSSCRMRSSSNPLQVIAECHLRSACHSAPTPSDHQSLQPPSFPFCVYFYRVEFMGLGPFFIPFIPFQFLRWILIQTAHVPELLDDGKYCRKILPSEESARTLQATDGRHICHKANVQLVSYVLFLLLGLALWMPRNITP